MHINLRNPDFRNTRSKVFAHVVFFFVVAHFLAATEKRIGSVFSPTLAYDGVSCCALCVDAGRLMLEREFAKTVLFDVRFQPAISNKVISSQPLRKRRMGLVQRREGNVPGGGFNSSRAHGTER